MTQARFSRVSRGPEGHRGVTAAFPSALMTARTRWTLVNVVRVGDRRSTKQLFNIGSLPRCAPRNSVGVGGVTGGVKSKGVNVGI